MQVNFIPGPSHKEHLNKALLFIQKRAIDAHEKKQSEQKAVNK